MLILLDHGYSNRLTSNSEGFVIAGGRLEAL